MLQLMCKQNVYRDGLCMFNFAFMPDVGMGYVSDPCTLFERFLAWPSLHPFTFLEMFLVSCLCVFFVQVCIFMYMH